MTGADQPIAPRRKLESWEHHVRHDHADLKDFAWCGVRLWAHDWAFVDVSHAAYTIRRNDTMQVCPDCAAAIVALFRTQEDAP